MAHEKLCTVSKYHDEMNGEKMLNYFILTFSEYLRIQIFFSTPPYGERISYEIRGNIFLSILI